MRIAIASGKGGTGKTTIATALALSLGKTGVLLLDCDVEEPNCHIFMKPRIASTRSVTVMKPVVDESRCDACGECGRFCQYKAIVSLKTTPLLFPELCHGCGGCTLVCPQNAISEGRREIGAIEQGRAGNAEFVMGRLNVGEAMSPPLIRAVKEEVEGAALTILDAPPGTACPVVEAIRGSDFVILVTEPTPFGLHDLTLAVEMVREMGIPCGAVVNRCDIGDERVREYCASADLEILAEIPFRRDIAEAYSRGTPLVEAAPEFGDVLRGMARRIGEIVGAQQ
jgi:MinD superfamily P-loop ATPase